MFSMSLLNFSVIQDHARNVVKWIYHKMNKLDFSARGFLLKVNSVYRIPSVHCKRGNPNNLVLIP